MDKILFLNEKDRNTGLSLEHSDYRYKTAKPVAATKPKHDEVGFTIPYAMFRPIREPGLLCELLGDNPVRRTADLKMNFDFLVKDLYENEISRLRLKKVKVLAKKYQCDPTQIALKYMLCKDAFPTIPIIGSGRLSEVKLSIEAMGIPLTKEECEYLENDAKE